MLLLFIFLLIFLLMFFIYVFIQFDETNIYRCVYNTSNLTPCTAPCGGTSIQITTLTADSSSRCKPGGDTSVPCDTPCPTSDEFDEMNDYVINGATSNSYVSCIPTGQVMMSNEHEPTKHTSTLIKGFDRYVQRKTDVWLVLPLVNYQHSTAVVNGRCVFGLIKIHLKNV